MKRILLVIVIAFSAILLSACATQRDAAPEIKGANLTPTVEVGDSYDPRAGVTVEDNEDDNDTLTAALEVRGYDPEDLLSVGTSTFTLYVKDSADNETSVTILLTVVQGHPSLSGVNLAPEVLVGDTFDPLAGITASDPQDGNITASLTTSGYTASLLDEAGEYTYTITATDSDGKTASATVVLTVSERPLELPTISGVNRNPSITQGDAFNPLAGVTAFDPQDLNITSALVLEGYDAANLNVPGTHTYTISVTDSDDNTVTVTVTLTVVALVITPPEFSGVQPVQTYYIGSGPYDPKAGVTAFDLIDGNLTSSIQVTGIYLLENPGTYQITLRVTNSAGIRTSVTISLTVAVSEVPINLTTDPVTVTLAHAMGESNQALIQKYADAFRAHYLALGHDLTVVVPAGVGGYDTLKNNMINAITAGDVPNLVQGYPDHVAEYLNGKAVVKLDPYIASLQWGLSGIDSFEDIIESYRQENSQYDAVGSFYSLPFNKSTEVMIYNKTAFDFLEIPEPQTWQDVIAAAPALKAYGDAIAEAKVRALNPSMGELELAPLIAAAKVLVVPASYDSTGNMFITFTRQFGGAYTSLNYQTFAGIYEWVGNENTISAMQFVKDNKALITIPEYWGQQYASVPFVNQQTFVTIGSSAGIRYNIPPVDPSTSEPVFQIGVGPVPYNADMPDHKAVIQQGTNISVMKSGTAQQQLVSWLFLKWLISIENTVDWAINTGYLPVRSSAYLSTAYQNFLNNPTANQRPISQAANAAFLQSGYMFYDPAFIGSSRARVEVGIAIERIVIGDGDITGALQDAYDEANLGG